MMIYLRPVLHGLTHGINHQRQPQQSDPFTENPLNLVKISVQEIFRVPQWKAHCNRVREALLEFVCTLFRLTTKHFFGIGLSVHLEQVSFIQLAHQVDDFFLAGGVSVEIFVNLRIDILHTALTIHHADELIGSRVESMAAARGCIFHQVPDLPTIVMAMNIYLIVKPWR